jgi:hypothetical protein
VNLTGIKREFSLTHTSQNTLSRSAGRCSFFANAMSYTSEDLPTFSMSLTGVLFGKPPPQRPLPDRLVLAAKGLLWLLPFALAISVWRGLKLVRKWHTSHPPAGTVREWVRFWALPLLGCVVIAAVTLWLWPWAFDLTLAKFLIFAPDYATLAIISGVFASAWGLLRSVLVAKLLLQRGNRAGRVTVLA